MTAAKDFLDFWIENSVHAAEQHGHRGGSVELRALVQRCTEMAKSEGFSENDLKAEVGDLSTCIRDLLIKANRAEDTRTDRHRNKG